MQIFASKQNHFFPYLCIWYLLYTRLAHLNPNCGVAVCQRDLRWLSYVTLNSIGVSRTVMHSREVSNYAI